MMISPAPGDYMSIFDANPSSDEFAAFKFWSKGTPPDFKQPTQAEILCEGLLEKQRETLNFLLVSRYYVLTKDLLYYYENEKKETISGFSRHIRFSKIREIPETKEQGKGFKISKNGQEFEFFTRDEDAYTRWGDALKRVCIATNFHDVYTVFKMLGKGSFSRVYLAQHRVTKQEYAVKALEKCKILQQAKGQAALFNEIDMLLEIDHDNIIRLHEAYESKGSVYLVMECLRGGELMNKITKSGSYDENDAKIIMRSLLKALGYLHERHIMHRDLKPENILLKDDVDTSYAIKIVDFGLATRSNIKEFIYSRCGTPGFVAPEVFTATGTYGYECDIFSAGIIFYLLLTGVAPFDDTNPQVILSRNKACVIKYDIPEFRLVSQEARSLLGKMLEKDPKNRISARDALKHPFFDDEQCNVTPSPQLRHSVIENMMKLKKLKEINMEIMKKYNIDNDLKPTKTEDGNSYTVIGDLLTKKVNPVQDSETLQNEALEGSFVLLQKVGGKQMLTSMADKLGSVSKPSAFAKKAGDTENSKDELQISKDNSVSTASKGGNDIYKKAILRNQALSKIEKDGHNPGFSQSARNMIKVGEIPSINEKRRSKNDENLDDDDDLPVNNCENQSIADKIKKLIQ